MTTSAGRSYNEVGAPDLHVCVCVGGVCVCVHV